MHPRDEIDWVDPSTLDARMQVVRRDTDPKLDELFRLEQRQMKHEYPRHVPLSKLGLGTSSEIHANALEHTHDDDVAGRAGRLEFVVEDVPGEFLRPLAVKLFDLLEQQYPELYNSYVLLRVTAEKV